MGHVQTVEVRATLHGAARGTRRASGPPAAGSLLPGKNALVHPAMVQWNKGLTMVAIFSTKRRWVQLLLGYSVCGNCHKIDRPLRNRMRVAGVSYRWKSCDCCSWCVGGHPPSDVLQFATWNVVKQLQKGLNHGRHP